MSSGSLPAVKIILEIAGQDCLEQREINNRTPLILATMGGHGEVVNYLLAHGGQLQFSSCLVLLTHFQHFHCFTPVKICHYTTF